MCHDVAAATVPRPRPRHPFGHRGRLIHRSSRSAWQMT